MSRRGKVGRKGRQREDVTMTNSYRFLAFPDCPSDAILLRFPSRLKKFPCPPPHTNVYLPRMSNSGFASAALDCRHSCHVLRPILHVHRQRHRAVHRHPCRCRRQQHRLSAHGHGTDYRSLPSVHSGALLLLLPGPGDRPAAGRERQLLPLGSECGAEGPAGEASV